MKIKVLIVKHDVRSVKDISSKLEVGNEIEICNAVYDGGEAVQSIKKYNPDVIILDLLLPNVDGIAVMDAPGMSCKWGGVGRDSERSPIKKQGYCRAHPEQEVLVTGGVMKIADVSERHICVRGACEYFHKARGFSLRVFCNEFSTLVEEFALV